MGSRQNPILVELTADEALVLFEWLARGNRSQKFDVEDQAEQRVLFDLEARLEKTLAAPFDPDYVNLLRDARTRVRDPE